MTTRNKIDSNETGLAIAKEVIGQPGVLPGTAGADAIWYDLEPNEYKDFGGEPTLLARRPINSSRQRKKGSIVDLDAKSGFNQDFTNDNSQLLVSGFMYANYREKQHDHPTGVTGTGYTVVDETQYFANMLVLASGFTTAANNGLKLVTSVDAGTHEVRVAGLVIEASPPAAAKILLVGIQGGAGNLDVTNAGVLPKVTSAVIDLSSLDLIPGEYVYIGGDSAGKRFATAANNGIKRIRSIGPGEVVFDKSDLDMVTEASTTETVQIFFGRVLKNELADLIVRQSFQMERKMGAPDTAAPSQIQAEYIIGAFPNELQMVVDSADKVNCDFEFIAITNEQKVSTTGIKAGTRVGVVESDAYNTSTDFSRLKLALVSSTAVAPLPLFAFVTDFTLSIKNNVSLNKAVGYLGGFDATIGLFEVSCEINAYFTKIESVQAVRNNNDVTLDYFVSKENRGFVVDLPLLALGGGMPDVKLDEPIMIPLKSDAATAVKMDANFNHTMLWVFFDYLPDAASA
jgi:hypothetical protein